ncbi:MAG: prepilin-type N-terminal cleavage/methylation domain-containing protein [Pseudomonadota bacterium]
MKHRGFTLVELLVSVTLGLVVIAGTLVAWMHVQRYYARAQTENRLHERAQYVFASLEPELQMAGYLGLGAHNLVLDGALPPSARRCGNSHVTDLGKPLETSDDRYTLACAAEGRGVVPATDTLTVRRASARLATPTPGRAQLLGALFTGAQLLWTGVLPSGTVLQPSLVELRDLIVRSYYVARSADGDTNTPALRVKTLTAISGTAAFVDTEVMEGIEDLQVTVLPPAGPPQSVRVTLGVRADAADVRVGEPLARARYTRHFTLRNAL